MTRIFVYEYLSGGGVVDDDPGATALLMPQGVAMRDAMVSDLLKMGACEVTVATCLRAPAVARGARAVVADPVEAPLAFVARQARGHDAAWVVAPETGGLLAAFARAIGPARWLGCEAAAIGLASSKGGTLAHLAAHGVPTPLAGPHHNAAQRWVVKPDDGAGGVDVRVFASQSLAEAERARRTAAGQPVWMEPWVAGDALSLSLWCRAGNAELLSVNRQQTVVDADGRLAYQGVAIDQLARSDTRYAALSALAGSVARAIPGLRGFAGIDLVWHAQHGPVVIEVNPRVTCAYVGLSPRLGRCLGHELLQLHRAETAHG